MSSPTFRGPGRAHRVWGIRSKFFFEGSSIFLLIPQTCSTVGAMDYRDHFESPYLIAKLYTLNPAP